MRHSSRLALLGVVLSLIPLHLTGSGAVADETLREGSACQCPDAPRRPQKLWPAPKYAAARPALDALDERAALQAVHVGLSELGDGATFFWHRAHGLLSGSVRPTSSFLDAEGRVCRHVVLTLSSNGYARSAEGIACRLADGSWLLEG